MLIFPTNRAFERQERIGIISLVKQVASGKSLRVRVLVPVENLESSQEFVQEPQRSATEEEEIGNYRRFILCQ